MDSLRGKTRRSGTLRSLSRQLALLDRLLTRPVVIELLGADRELVRTHAGMQRLCFERASQLRLAVAEAMDAMQALRRCPATSAGAPPRILELARAYLAAVRDDVGSETYSEYVRRAVTAEPLSSLELALALPAVQVVCLSRLSDHLVGQLLGQRRDAACEPVVALVVLDTVERTDAAAFVRALCPFEAVLERDPAGCYPRMDARTKQQYREAVDAVAERCACRGLDIAESAVALAEQALGQAGPEGGDRDRVDAHIGHFLLGGGRARLIRHRSPRTKPTWGERIRSLEERIALLGHQALVAALAAGLTWVAVTLWRLQDRPAPVVIAVGCLLFLIAFEAAAMVVEAALLWFLPRRECPAMDFAAGLPEEARTLVCVPTLLTSKRRVEELVLGLRARHAVERDDNLRFALLTDWEDAAAQEPTARDRELVCLCARLVGELNAEHGGGERGPFYMLHRDRQFSSSQDRWLGRERKMGKLHALNRFLAGGGSEFSQVVGDIASLRRTRYVMVLDDDTAALPGAVRALAAAIHHPLNRPRVSSRSGDVVAGYGMMRGPILAREESLRPWRRPGLFLRSQPVLDGRTSRMRFRNLAFDFCGQAAFVGKGIYDATLAHELLGDRLPPERVLSHDLVEGGLLRTGFVSDAKLVDQFPDTYFGYSDRVHRWIRGDWQNLGLLLYPGRMWGANRHGRRIPAFLRFVILSNLRVSSYVVVYTALFCIALALDPDRAGARVLATICLTLAPVLVRLAGDLLRMMVRGTLLFEAGRCLRSLRSALSSELVRLITAPHHALLTLDAIGRSLYRMAAGRGLLEWRASSHRAGMESGPGALRWYLAVVPVLCVALAAALVGGPGLGLAGWIVLALWACSPLAIRQLIMAPAGNARAYEPGPRSPARAAQR